MDSKYHYLVVKNYNYVIGCSNIVHINCLIFQQTPIIPIMITNKHYLSDDSTEAVRNCGSAPVSRSRRRLVSSLLTLPLSANVFAGRIAPAAIVRRELSFYHTHTGKRLAIEYHNGHSYLIPALNEINQFLSDFRTGEVYPIDRGLLDALFVLQQKSGIENSFEVISGYRSPKTNAKLCKNSKGVAKHSLHMQGKAIDIRLKGYNTRTLRELAMSMKVGGVGYYRRSNFIHMDTGRVRYW